MQYAKSPARPSLEPQIIKLKPAAAKRGALVTITGINLRAAQATGAVKFGAKACTKYVSWSATQIRRKAPTEAKYGKVSVTVTTAGVASNAMGFAVKR